MKDDLKPIRVDVPGYVHEQLKLEVGSKKANAERVLIDWANKQKKKRK